MRCLPALLLLGQAWARGPETSESRDLSRAKRDICLGDEERCFDDIGCVPCKYNHGSFSPEDINMSFYFYSPVAREQILHYKDLAAAGKMKKLKLATDRDLWVIVHGFEGQWPLEWLDIMRTKLVNRGNVVLVTRWTDGTSYPANYPQAAVNGLTVGKMIGRVLLQLSSAKGLSLDRVHLIGFSLGVHIAGHAGAATGGRVRQVVGLDPPEKLYEDEDAAFRLDPSDAQIVQVIHTHGDSLMKGGLGTLVPMGDIDIYVNGGKRQPGCEVTGREDISVSRFYDLIKIVGCNHIRSTALFSDSIENNCHYTAFHCPNRAMWKRGQCFGCAGGECIQMGYNLNTSTTLRGKFYVNTLIDQGINEPREAYCGKQYRVTLFPDREVKGIIDLTIIDSAYSTKPQRFTSRTATLYAEGRSGVVTANTMSPKRLKVEYNRFNVLLKKSHWSFNLTRAVLLDDEGSAWEYRGGVMVEDDYSTTVDLSPVELDAAAFMRATAWTSDAADHKPWWWPDSIFICGVKD